MKRILIVAGGTGGHIFPALAIARELREQNIDVHWLGSSEGLEKKLVSSEFPFHGIQMSHLRKKNKWYLLPGRLLSALFQARRIVRDIKPQLVLGMGGYVSAPGSIAAWLKRIPLIIHEQNAVPGRTNRLLSKIAHKTLEAFPNTFARRHRVKTTGNPIRAELIQSPVPHERFLNREGPLRLLVLGGSQGARPINEALISLLTDYPHLHAQIELWHQTGALDFEHVKRAYEKLSVKGNIMPFIEEMAAPYCWADLVICRAGALTISEIAAVGLGSILIPYPHAADNHQWHNGLFLERIGAAILLEQRCLTKEYLLELVQSFVKNRTRLLAMAQSARSFSQPKAAEQVIAECTKYWE
jgi:UDP-N-acetylglucosamine--N-acetylmuramyl-(pentapeptide) pyrophosphoryl-undecaprenol N-acetylglucosamine transferase